MSTDRLQYLLDRLFQGELTLEEKEELALWTDTLQNDEEWKMRLSKIWNNYEPEEKMEPSSADVMLKKILLEGKTEEPPAKTVSLPYTPVSGGMMKWAVAAAAVIGILIVLSLVFLVPRPNKDHVVATNHQTSQKQDIIPGGNKAVLTLANGKKIVLNKAGNGSLAQQGNTKVIKVNSGLISYNRQEAAAGGSPSSGSGHRQYNMIATPRGGQYEIILPDGSKVWLNAASSLKFPTAFMGKKREVEMTGEAYFEITKDVGKPFIVKKGDMEIQVLGTHFNVMAYDKETNMKVTLLEGAVKIAPLSGNGEGLGVRLKPGEQALVNENNIQVNKNVNINEVIAWKNGLFDFEGNDIKEVMQQIARWYDVEVKYENVPSAHFMGTISRNVDVSEVLKMLEMTGAVHFKVEGRTIMVL
jgi:ferric-dicitrate binding protein FerR (iron transport regulator)